MPAVLEPELAQPHIAEAHGTSEDHIDHLLQHLDGTIKHGETNLEDLPTILTDAMHTTQIHTPLHLVKATIAGEDYYFLSATHGENGKTLLKAWKIGRNNTLGNISQEQLHTLETHLTQNNISLLLISHLKLQHEEPEHEAHEHLHGDHPDHSHAHGAHHAEHGAHSHAHTGHHGGAHHGGEHGGSHGSHGHSKHAHKHAHTHSHAEGHANIHHAHGAHNAFHHEAHHAEHNHEHEEHDAHHEHGGEHTHHGGHMHIHLIHVHIHGFHHGEYNEHHSHDVHNHIHSHGGHVHTHAGHHLGGHDHTDHHLHHDIHHHEHHHIPFPGYDAIAHELYTNEEHSEETNLISLYVSLLLTSIFMVFDPETIQYLHQSSITNNQLIEESEDTIIEPMPSLKKSNPFISQESKEVAVYKDEEEFERYIPHMSSPIYALPAGSYTSTYVSAHALTQHRGYMHTSLRTRQ